MIDADMAAVLDNKEATMSAGSVHRELNVQEFIDTVPAGRFHFRVLTVGSVLLLADGYELGLYGAALPLARDEFTLAATTAGLIGAGTLAGMLVGAVALGSFSDRFGRRPLLAVAVALVSLGSLGSALSPSPGALFAFRAVTGVGAGALLPLVSALAGEYAPRRWRSAFTMWVGVGFALGTVLSAYLSSLVIETVGWRGMMASGVAPVALIPFIWLALREPLSFLVRTGRLDEAADIIRRIHPDADVSSLAIPEEDNHRVGLREIFRVEVVARTLLIGGAFGACLLALYGLVTWAPGVLVQAGYSLSSSLLMLMLINLGGVAGILLAGLLSSRLGVFRVVVIAYALAAALLAVLGTAPPSSLLALLLFFCGLAGNAAVVGQMAYAGQAYPARLRATAIGWGVGAGRIGAIAGPIVGGILLDSGADTFKIFSIFAVPAGLAILALTLAQRFCTPASD